MKFTLKIERNEYFMSFNLSFSIIKNNLSHDYYLRKSIWIY